MKAPSFLPPSALQAEVTRTKRLKEDAEDAAKVTPFSRISATRYTNTFSKCTI